MQTVAKQERFLDLKIIIIYVTSFAFLALLQILLFTIAPSILNDEALFTKASVLINVAWYIVLTVSLLFITRHYFKHNQLPKTKANLNKVIKIFLIGMVLMFLANAISAGVFHLMGIDQTSENQAGLEAMANLGIWTSLGLVLFAGFLAPIAEEIVFRKGLYGLVYKKMGNLAAIIISAFVFAFIHVIVEILNAPIMILPYLGLGLVLSAVYYYSGKLLIVPIAMHMAMNLISVTVIFLF